MQFKDVVLIVVAGISRGRALTYKEVAQRAGSPRAYRAVGNILNKNYDPAIPCHRVVRSDGTPGGYNRGRTKKIALLRKEGYYKSDSGIVQRPASPDERGRVEEVERQLCFQCGQKDTNLGS